MTVEDTDILHWENGDVIGGTSVDPSALDVSTTYSAYPHYLRYPTGVLGTIEDDDTTLFVSPADYNAISVEWSITPEARTSAAWLVIVRSGFGWSRTPNDGVRVMTLRNNEGGAPLIVDSPLQPGRWYYYTLMAKVGTEWQELKRSRTQVPIDYNHRERLWDMLPPYYQELDDGIYDSTPNSALKRMFETVGFEFDRTRTMTEGIEYTYSADLAPYKLIEEFGKQNLGVANNSTLEGVRYRSLVSRAYELANQRGTLIGIKTLAETVSQCDTDARSGRNLLLVPDDSEFVHTTGNWAAAPGPVANFIADNNTDLPSGVVRDDMLITDCSLAVTEDITPPIIDNRPVSRGVMRVSPKVRVTQEDDGGWKLKERVSDLCITCGLGQKPVINSEGVVQSIEMDPLRHGIPVVKNNVYHFSMFVANSGVRDYYDLNYYNGSSITTSTNEVEWWDLPNYPHAPKGKRSLVEQELTYNVVLAVAWFDRDTLKEATYGAFNNGFGQGTSADVSAGRLPNEQVLPSGSAPLQSFEGYRFVPFETILSLDQSENVITAANEWRYVTYSHAAQGDIAVPILLISPVNGTARDQSDFFVAGVSFTEQQDSGVETQFGPGYFITLGDSADVSASSILGDTGGYLGPPGVT